MNSVSTSGYTIITGKYETGTPEQKKAISDIFGADQIEHKYRLYFYWYNVIHELGHAILHFNEHKKLLDVEEEPIVNDFAVAYWSIYGENSKFNEINELVQNTVHRFACPAPAGLDYMAYARANWGNEELFTFNNYGWFQFSCVFASLHNQKLLAEVLQTMSTNLITPRPKQILVYDIHADDQPFQIVKDATLILREWGVTLPDLPHLMVNDPNRHGVSTVGY